MRLTKFFPPEQFVAYPCDNLAGATLQLERQTQTGRSEYGHMVVDKKGAQV